MFKLKQCVFLLLIIEYAAPQFIEMAQLNQIMQFLNSLTVNDISSILRQLPIPNPLFFDGAPVLERDIIYNLYTRHNPKQPIPLDQSNIAQSIIPKHPVKFLIHGWLEDGNRTYYRELIDAYMQRGDYNVIAIDWSVPAGSYDYTQAARNTKTTGRSITEFIMRLNKVTGVPYSNMHILGHSLGAHVAGFAGKQLYRKTKKKIGRISALDAAGPLFETPISVDKNTRLDKTDAEFVDAIHTDGGIFGMIRPIGHVDFYPNGGVPRQPGCRWINVKDLSTSVLIDDMFCSHYKSHEFYAESINSKNFLSVQCNSYEDFQREKCSSNKIAIMGEDTDKNNRGTYFLETNTERPFAKQQTQNYYQYI